MTDRLDEIRARREAAVKMVSALCKPKYSEGAREWIMSIPARPDHDPDIVIAASLRDIAYLLGEMARLQYLNDELEQENREFRDMKVSKP